MYTWLGDVQRDGNVTKEEPLSATFKLNKETRNTIHYAEERRPIVGMVYVDKYGLPKPYPEKVPSVTVSLDPLLSKLATA